jgi:hypothetical protein
MTTLIEITKDSYAAYGETVGWKNYAGLPMPTWEELPPKIQEAWRAATKETLRKTLGDVLQIKEPNLLAARLKGILMSLSAAEGE